MAVGQAVLMADLTVTEAGLRLGVDPSLIRRWIRAGRIVARRAGRRVYLIDEAAIAALDARLGKGRGPKKRGIIPSERPASAVIGASPECPAARTVTGD